MGSYASFARYYDGLTQNVEYQRRAEYLCEILKQWATSRALLWIWLVGPAP